MSWRREQLSYLGPFLVLMIMGMALNLQAAIRFGIGLWGEQDIVAFLLLACGLAASQSGRASGRARQSRWRPQG